MLIRRSTMTMLCLILLLITALSPASAQATTALTLSVFDGTQSLYEPVLARFKEANPDIDVIVTGATPTMNSDLTKRLDAARDSAQKADVMTVSAFDFDEALAGTGYFLDISAMLAGDATFNADAYFPAVRDAFTMDGKVYGLPGSAVVALVNYDPAAFDAAGLPYPAGNWTMQDYANAAQKLTQRRDDGTVRAPGLLVESIVFPAFLHGLTGSNFTNMDTFPPTASLSTPEIVDALTAWQSLVASGDAATTLTNRDVNLPLMVSFQYNLSPKMAMNTDAPAYAGALMPGDTAGIFALGYAISSGTQNPEAAYRLVRFLADDAEVTGFTGGTIPARSDLVTDATLADYPPDAQTVLLDALNQGISIDALRYRTYLLTALSAIEGGADPLTTLQSAETQAQSDAEIVAARASESITVESPATPAPVAEGDITLNFGIWTGSTSFGALGDWQKVAQEFADSDPQVGQVNINFVAPVSNDWYKNVQEPNDCFYNPGNAVQQSGIINLDNVLPLDPLIDADPTFDPNDILPGVLEQVQANGQTLALPMSMTPLVLSYNADAMTKAGVFIPPGEWSIDDLVNALNTIKPLMDAEQSAMYPYEFDGAMYLSLIAAYGGLPIDTRTNPPTLDFTNPDTVNAIRQVLDMAKSKLIHHEELARAIRIFSLNYPGPNKVLFAEPLGHGSSTIAPFPSGDIYTVMSFDLNTAFINKSAQYPEACYRWLRTVSQHPELLLAMPVTQSMLDSDGLLAAEGQVTVDAYRTIAERMSRDNLVVLNSAGANYYPRLWLNRAFDNYVMHDADLETELQTAQSQSETFRQCANSLPAAATNRGYLDALQQCAIDTDASLAEYHLP